MKHAEAPFVVYEVIVQIIHYSFSKITTLEARNSQAYGERGHEVKVRKNVKEA